MQSLAMNLANPHSIGSSSCVKNLNDSVRERDSQSESKRIYAWVPRSEVVYLQAIFDAYEGIGRIRTEKHLNDRSMILVMTTPDQETHARDILRQIQTEISGQIDFV